MEDKTDVVSYLKRALEQKTNQITELRARLDGLQQTHKEHTEVYAANVTTMKDEFAKTKKQLVSENMVLNKKLDALEEFRIQRVQLNEKFEDQEKQLYNIKQGYENKIAELNKQHIMEEDR